MNEDTGFGLHGLPNERKIHSMSTVSGYLLDVSHSFERGNVVSVSKWEASDGGEASSLVPVAKWDRADGNKLGSCAALDVQTEHVFAALKGRRSLAVFPFSSGSKRLHANVVPLEFKGHVFATATLRCLRPEGEGDLIVAVSCDGELEAFSVQAMDGEIKRKALKSLPLTSVLFVTSFHNDHLLVVGKRNSSILVFPIRFVGVGGFQSLEANFFPSIQLPPPPPSSSSSKTLGDCFVLGFHMTERCAFVLYSGGYVHILVPESHVGEKQSGSLKPWYKCRKSSFPGDPTVIEKPADAFQISPGSSENNRISISKIWGDSKEDAGGVQRLGTDYVVIGYGQIVSVWDGVYRAGHAVAQIRGRVTALAACPESVRAVIGSENGFEELAIENPAPLSLAVAMKSRGTCDSIVTKIPQVAEAVPVHSQPVTVGATRVAAETCGATHGIFSKLLNSLDMKELKIVRALIDRNATGTAEAVARLVQQYTTEFKKVRRGNRGKAIDLGLSNLPSERLAAVSVARCLYEIHAGHARYLVPLIDMVGTGVVSSEAVLPVVEMSGSWQMGPDGAALSLGSIVDPLLSSPTFLNALEAIVCRVSDLPETDLVRVLQFAVRVMQVSALPESEEDVAESLESTASSLRSRQFSQARRLLLTCVNAPVDKGKVVESLRQVPFADVTAILERLDQIFNLWSSDDLKGLRRLPPPPDAVKRGFFCSTAGDVDVALYRGVGNWLDNERVGTRETPDGMELHGCIGWTCHLIDAHLATLVMDGAGRRLAVRLLETVRQRKREFEVLKSLQGLTSHIVGHHPVPSERDPLYSSTKIQVPAYAALR